MSRLLNESWIEGLPDPIVENLEALNRYVVLRICERIRKIGDIGAADAHRLKSAVEYAAMREVKKQIASGTKSWGLATPRPPGKRRRVGRLNFFEYVIWRYKCRVRKRRPCWTCRGSDGHCDECNKYHNLYKKDWRKVHLQKWGWD